MSEQTIYDTLRVQAIYSADHDTVLLADNESSVIVNYFTLEEIMENARKAHVMRNNLRTEGEE